MYYNCGSAVLSNILVFVKRYLPLLLLLCSPAVLMAQIDTVINKIKKIPTKHVDALAKFPYGNFKDYVAAKLQNPHHIDNDINGQIVLLTEISDDGSIGHITILKSLSPFIDQEIVKVVNASPKWQPAMLGGKKTNMNMVFSIDIVIKSDEKITVSKVAVKYPVTSKVQIQSVQAPLPVQKPLLPTSGKSIVTASKPVVTSSKKTMPAPVVKKPLIVAKSGMILLAAKKTSPVLGKNIEPPVKHVIPPPVVVKKAKPPVKKAILQPVKKAEPVIAKKINQPVKKVFLPVKKPEPVVVKKLVPPIIKVIPPQAKKPDPVIVKKPEPVKKSPFLNTPVVAKKTVTIPKIKLQPVKKLITIVAKTTQSQVIKTSSAAYNEPGSKVSTQINPPANKPKRKVVKGNLFKPAEDNAIFPNGGLPALYHFLGQNITYPPMSKAGGIEGTVMLRFVVDEEGTVTDVEVLSSPADDLSQEAIRVFLASPRWKPARQNGSYVAVSFEIPIKFSLGPKTPTPQANN